MPIMKCYDCHHEWEGQRKECDWCDSKNEAIILKDKSELENMISRWGGSASQDPHKVSKVSSKLTIRHQ